MKLIIKFAATAAALWLAAWIVPGIELSDNIGTILWVALIFGLVNMFIKPIVKLLTLPMLLITLGLFAFVINAALLLLTAWLTDGLTVDGFLAALLGSLVISAAGFVTERVVDAD
ncbi:MAG TPA: phage holin family protein [Acidimicrobiia bacterium]|nr:phage holin family protein [Acidimicrobiia bacterium]